MLKYKSCSWYCTHKKRENSFAENLLRLRNIQNIACFVKPMEVCNFYRGRNVEKLIYQWNYCAKYPVSLQVIGPWHKSFDPAIFVTRKISFATKLFLGSFHTNAVILERKCKTLIDILFRFPKSAIFMEILMQMETKDSQPMWCCPKISAMLQNLQWKCLHSFPCL